MIRSRRIDVAAEGRLILADALTHARRSGATHILDLATLTGAMEVALGDFYAGIFANEDAWRDQVVEAGEASGDHAWPFPMHPRYRRYVDSVFADLKNSSDLRQAGVSISTREGEIAGTLALSRNLTVILVIVATLGATGYLVSLAASLWANAQRKRREIRANRDCNAHREPARERPPAAAGSPRC